VAASTPVETETKLRLADREAFEARLAALGATPGAVDEERNVLFDAPDGELRRKGCALRIRTIGDRGLLTFKGPARVVAGVKSRRELETGVDSPERLAEVLGELGLAPRFTYEKRRTTWRFADSSRPLVVVDETPIGLFAEVEGEDGAVRALCAELGVPEGDWISESYVTLYVRAREADPSLPADMVFARAEAATP
jgi:adenylate cyclase class 2